MQVVQREDTYVVGLRVSAHFSQLNRLVPSLWQELFARREELPETPGEPFVEASVELGDGLYRETVGVALHAQGPAPTGMVLAHVPAGRFVHHRHVGPVEDIARGFQAIYDWSAEQDLTLGSLKLDFGYTVGGSEPHHDLFIDVVE